MVPIYEQIMDQNKAAVIIGELPKPRCITGLVGQNGAGKTTTFKSILDLIHLDGGTVGFRL